MTTSNESSGKRERVILYSVIGVLVLALLVVAVLARRTANESREAEEKADRLIAALEELGARTPSRDQVVGLFGDDGGAVCADPAGALNRAAELAGMSNGAGGPGMRPVIADSLVVQGELLVIGIYCPDKLSDFTEFVDSLRTDDVAE